MADETSTFAVALEDGTSDVAQDAASALEHLKESLTAGLGELSEMNRALRVLKAGGLQSTAQFKDLTDRVKAQKAALGETQAAYLRLGGSLKKTKPPIADMRAEVADLRAVVGQMGGPLNGLIGRIGNLRGLLASGALIAGAVAFAAGLTAVAVAAMAAAAALFKYAVASSEARRNERLQLEGLTKIRNWYGIAAGKAGDLQAAIDKVSDSSNLGRDKINDLAAGLYRSNLRGAALEQALEGVAIATDVAGEAQGAFYREMFLGAGRYGGSTKKVLDDVRARFGAIAAAKGLSLDVQARKLRENFARIFSGLNLEKLLGGMREVTGMFSQTEASGRALKAIVESLFQPLADFVGGEGLLVKRFMQGLVIGALVLTIGVLRVRNALKRAFGDVSILKNIDGTRLAVLAGVSVMGALAGIVGSLTAGLVGLSAVAALVAAAFLGPIVTLAAFARKVRDTWSYVSGLDWGEVAADLVRGLADGISDGAQWVVDAVKGLGAKAMTALREKLQIFSPSRAFAKLGVELPRGLGGGVKAGTGHAVAAVRRMAARAEGAFEVRTGPAPVREGGAPAGGGRRPPDSPGTNGAPVFQVTIPQLIVQAASGEPAAIRDAVEEAIGAVLERVAIQMGARPAAGG